MILKNTLFSDHPLSNLHFTFPCDEFKKKRTFAEK
jgi:hypothetical protein